MPTNPSDDELALFSQLEDVFAEVDEDEAVINLRELSTPSLVRLVNKSKERLFEIGQAIKPNSQEARDLHSQYYAYHLELRRRGY